MRTLSPVRILLVNVGGPGTPGIIRSLRQNGERDVWLAGIDINPDFAARTLIDHFEVPPRTDDPAFMPFVRELCARERINVVMPLSSVGLMLFRDLADDQNAPKVLISSRTSLERSLNKKTLFDVLTAAGLGELVPVHHSASTRQEFEAALQALGFPERDVCFKPEDGKGGRGFRVLRYGAPPFSAHLSDKDGSGHLDATTLFSHPETPDTFKPLLVMEYLPGREYSVDVLCKDGEPLVVVPRTRDVIQSGISAGGITEDNREMRDAAETIARAIEGEYLLNIQLRYAADGTPKLLEVNPRISGTIVHCTCAGANLPYLALKQLLGEPFDIPEPRWGIRLARGYFESYTDADGTWKLL